MSSKDVSDNSLIGLPLVYQDASGEWQFGRVEAEVGGRLLVRKGGVVKVIAKPEVVCTRLAASFGAGQDEEFAFYGSFNNSITLWEGGKEFRGRVVDVPRSGECKVEFRDGSGFRRIVGRFQDEVALHRRISSGRGNERRPVEEEDSS